MVPDPKDKEDISSPDSNILLPPLDSNNPIPTKKHQTKRPVALFGAIILAIIFIGILFTIFALWTDNYGSVGLAFRSIFTSQPNPLSGNIISDRKNTTNRIDLIFSGIQKQDNSLHYYATGTQDLCYAGSTDPLGPDKFLYKCSLDITNFYGFTGNFTSAMNDLANVLKLGGWGITVSYYDQSLQDAQTYYQYSSNPSWLVSSNPATYVDGSMGPYDKGNLLINLDYEGSIHALHDTGELSTLSLDESMDISETTFYTKSNYVNLGKLTNDVIAKGDQYVLAMSIQTSYFTE
jgi:hypothetical protein